MSALTKRTPPLSGVGFGPADGVKVIEVPYLRKDSVHVIDGVAHVGSFEYLRLMLDLVNAHRVGTSPECWITDDGELVDVMPVPMGPLP